MLLHNCIKALVISFLCALYVKGMEKELPQQGALSQEQIWKQLKQKMGLLKELKLHFAKMQNTVTSQPLPAHVIPQSVAQLRALFGQNKTDKELVTRAINSVNSGPAYKLQMELLGTQYIGLAKTILDTEKQYGNYYVLYHGQQGALILIHDIMRALFSWLELENPDQKTQFLRLFAQHAQEYKNVDSFLEKHKSGMVKKDLYDPLFDHIPEVRKNLLSANFSLFGNFDNDAESTWYFFTAGHNVKAPALKEQLLNFFTFFDFNEKYIDRLLEIHQKYLQSISQKVPLTKEQGSLLGTHVLELNPGILCQIFIHPDVIDQIAYLAKPGGYLFTGDLNQYEMWQASKFHQTEVPSGEWYKRLATILDTPEAKQLQEQGAQLYQETFEAKLGRMSVRKYLDIFRSKPGAIDAYIMNYVQGRMYLQYSLLADPEKIKIVLYTTPVIDAQAGNVAQKEYTEKLAALIEEMMKDWLFKDKKRVGEKTKLERFFEFLTSR